MNRIASRGLRLGSALVLIALGGCLGDGERLEVPTPVRQEYTDLRLTCVTAPSPHDVIAGGWLDRTDGGVEALLVRTRDGGRTWRRLGVETWPVTGAIVQDVHFNDRLRGWAAGVRATESGPRPFVARTEDGGGRWRESEIPEPRAAVVSHVRDLDFSNDDIGIVELVYADSETGQLVGNRYRTQDGGRTWLLDGFLASLDEEIPDQALDWVSEAEAWRIDAPDPHGVQTLWSTVSAGTIWTPTTRFHVSRFDDFYGPLGTRHVPREPSPIPASEPPQAR